MAHPTSWMWQYQLTLTKHTHARMHTHAHTHTHTRTCSIIVKTLFECNLFVWENLLVAIVHYYVQLCLLPFSYNTIRCLPHRNKRGPVLHMCKPSSAVWLPKISILLEEGQGLLCPTPLVMTLLPIEHCMSRRNLILFFTDLVKHFYSCAKIWSSGECNNPPLPLKAWNVTSNLLGFFFLYSPHSLHIHSTVRQSLAFFVFVIFQA